MKYVDLYTGNGIHKYTAIIHTDYGKKSVKFGDNRYEDFTIHKDPERKMRYIKRHESREDWSETGYGTPGFWSRWLLWEKDGLKKAIKFMREKKKIDIILRRKPLTKK